MVPTAVDRNPAFAHVAGPGLPPNRRTKGMPVLIGDLWANHSRPELQLDRFWPDRLPTSRKRTRWDQVLQVLVSYPTRAPMECPSAVLKLRGQQDVIPCVRRVSE
jgi:hypothetical protein